jgi:hypothetical protein
MSTQGTGQLQIPEDSPVSPLKSEKLKVTAKVTFGARRASSRVSARSERCADERDRITRGTAVLPVERNLQTNGTAFSDGPILALSIHHHHILFSRRAIAGLLLHSAGLVYAHV